MSNLLELAKRCEKAEGPDRLIDIAILQATDSNGYRVEDDGTILVSGDMGDGPGWFNIGYEVPAFTASLDAALTLVPADLYWIIGHGRESEMEPLGGCIITTVPHGAVIAEAEAATATLATCAAALRARAAAMEPSR